MTHTFSASFLQTAQVIGIMLVLQQNYAKFAIHNTVCGNLKGATFCKENTYVFCFSLFSLNIWREKKSCSLLITSSKWKALNWHGLDFMTGIRLATKSKDNFAFFTNHQGLVDKKIVAFEPTLCYQAKLSQIFFLSEYPPIIWAIFVE